MRIKTNGIAKWITGAALAAALLLATPNKAQAQVAFQVGIGGGGYGYGAPVYNAYGAYGAVPYDNWHRAHWADRRQDYGWQAQRAAEWRHDWCDCSDRSRSSRRPTTEWGHHAVDRTEPG